MKFLDKNTTAIAALGGLGEVGKNMYMVQHQNEIILIDAGVMFTKDNLLGVDYIIPDLQYLMKNEKKIKALFITHAHEDHIGGLPYILKKVNIPVIYSAKLGINLIRNKLKMNGIDTKNLVKFYEFSEKTIFQSKYFNIGFYLNIHSIPDSYGIYVNTPNGRILHSGDFKFDFTPVGNPANYAKITQLGKEGVDLLLSDSTNSTIEGFSDSEKKVSEEIFDIISKAKGRVIIGAFSSNIYRIHKIIEASIKNNKKIAVFGRSMENIVSISRRIGFIKQKKEHFILDRHLKKYPDNKVTILCTGSQGEELATLSRIANGSHRFIKLKDNDTIVFSSSPIPGNFLNVYELINKLLKRKDINLIYGKDRLIHASGHANKEEQKLLLNLVSPVNFMPVHGENHMLHEHALTAQKCGVNSNNCFVQKNGDVLGLKKGKVKYIGKISGEDWFVEKDFIGVRNNNILEERQIMSENGVLIAYLKLDFYNKKIHKISNVTISTIGIDKSTKLENYIKILRKKIQTNTKFIDKYENMNKFEKDLKIYIENELKSLLLKNPKIIIMFN